MEGLLQDLGSVAQEAAKELGRGATSDEVAAHAVKVGQMKAIVATKLTKIKSRTSRYQQVLIHQIGAIIDIVYQ